MELCTARGTPTPILPPSQNPKHFATSHVQFQPVLRCKTHFPFLQNHTRVFSGSHYCRNLSLRSTSEETSAGTTPYVKDEPKPDSVITEGDSQPLRNEEDYDSQQNEAPQEGSLLENLELFKFLEDLDIKFDYEDTYSILVFGGGGAVALWLLAAVVSAIDSIPVFPKVLELVGLGYTLWFSSRYLVFKKNRDELVAKIEQIKQQVLGSKDE
ncbi:protein CURVATURE THYLAKOID 1D, chloroplastic [Sesamum indicum]|uniref:Protein CURVATURE THYLAKOID 1D, chloroplastic n=1 Tax=Sesamum indicum TaxID=4182 RepID=A0A6I9UCC9_SESIN|nr:protein CURVATURE THYLAKOID 1D, chloroplastic [Sesamum indicum]